MESNGERSKAMKACEANSKITFVPSSMRQVCQICLKDDCHFFKPLLQQEYGRHAAYGKDAMLDNFQDKNDDVRMQLKTEASTSSSPHGGKKDEHAKQHKRYKSTHD